MNLIEKKRVASKIVKRYDKFAVPYQRVLESPHIPEQTKYALRV